MKIKQEIKKLFLVLLSAVMIITSLRFVKFDNVQATPTIEKNYHSYWLVNGGPDNGFEIRINGQQAYCVQPYEHLDPTANYSEVGYNEVGLTGQQAKIAQLISYYGYGYPGRTDPGYEEITQVAIWRYLGADKYVISTLLSQSYMATRNQTLSLVDQIMADVNNFNVTPSFHNESIVLVAGEIYTFTDTNNVLEGYNVIATGGIEVVSKTGNTLVIKATQNSEDNATILLERDMSQNPRAQNTPMYYYNSTSQNLMIASAGDPTESWIKVQVQKTGSLEIAKQDDKANYISGVTFNVSYNSDMSNSFATVTTGNDGKVTVNEILANVPIYVQEVSVPNYLTIDKTIYQTSVTAGNTVSYTANNDRVYGTITLKKYDSETGSRPQGRAKLENAKYGLYAKNDIKDSATGEVIYFKDTLIGTALTNQDGQIVWTNLELGTYYIKELAPSEGYLLDDTIYDVDISYVNNTTKEIKKEVIVKEVVKKGAFNLTKITTNGTTGIQQVEKNVKFELYSKTTGLLADTIITDSNGRAETILLPYDTYIVKQVTNPYQTWNCEDFEVTISEDSRDIPLYYVLNNGEVDIYVTLEKIDDRTNKIVLLPNFEFKIMNVDTGEYVVQKIGNKYIDTFITDETGTVTTPLKLTAGNYKIVEMKVQGNYTLNTKELAFTVSKTSVYQVDNDGDAFMTIKFYNKAVKGVISVYKEGEVLTGFENGKFIYNLQGLEGVEIQLIADQDIYTDDNQGILLYAKGDVVANQFTNASGFATFTDLPLAKYKVKEINTVNGYVLSNEILNVTLKYKDQHTAYVYESVTLTNARQKVKIDVTKADEELNINLANAEIGLYNTNDIIVNGKVIVPKNTLLESVITNKEGKATFGIDVPINTEYYIKEINAPVNYVLNDEKINVSTTWQGQKVETIKTSHTINNKLVKGKIVVNKYALTIPIQEETENGDSISSISLVPLKDIEFELVVANNIYDNNKNLLVKKGTIIDTLITDEKGNLCFENLYLGDYILREKTPLNYVLNDEIKISLKYKNQTTAVITHSERIINELTTTEISKQDITSQEGLENANLVLTDSIGNVIDEWVSSTESHIIRGLERGKEYILTETIAPNGYVLKEDSITFIINEDGTITHVVMYNEQTTTEISKKDITNQKELEGAKLVLKDSENNNIDEWISTNEPHVIRGLLVGETYTLTEIIAPENYELANDIVFTVNDDGTVTKVVMYDEPIKQIVETSDPTNAFLYIALVGIVLVGVSFILIKKKQKHDEETSNIENLK